MIRGTVRAGAGKAVTILESVFAARCVAANAKLVRGTLNVHVRDLDGTVLSLGKPHFKTDADNNLGPLQWWRVLVIGKYLPERGVTVAGVNSPLVTE